MIRTRAMLVSATAAACLAGVAAGSIGAAQATSTGATGSTGTTGATATTGATPTPATITVNGAAIATVDTTTDVATQHSAYLSALGNAVSDAKTKAGALSTQVGDTLGAVQTLTEQSSYSGGAYCGGRVMMGASGVAKGAPSVGQARRPSKKKVHHAANVMYAIAQPAPVTPPTTCTIEADVTVTYSMS